MQKMNEVAVDQYASEDGNFFMAREAEYGSFWVLRDASGKYLGHDQYRTDLASRHNLSL